MKNFKSLWVGILFLNVIYDLEVAFSSKRLE